jgi:hypothetical protein
MFPFTKLFATYLNEFRSTQTLVRSRLGKYKQIVNISSSVIVFKNSNDSNKALILIILLKRDRICDIIVSTNLFYFFQIFYFVLIFNYLS